jgi:hypothetical protein
MLAWKAKLSLSRQQASVAGSDKTGGGAASTMLSESQLAGVGSVCALTPSHVLAEVYHHDALLQHRARGGVAAESCCWRVG